MLEGMHLLHVKKIGVANQKILILLSLSSYCSHAIFNDKLKSR